MKKLLILAGLVTALCGPCYGQIGAGSATLTTPSGVVAGGTSNSINAVMPCQGFETIALVIRAVTAGAASGPGTNVLTVTLQRSADGSIFETTPGVVYVMQLNGATTAYGFTNITLNGARALRLAGVVNAETSAVSALQFKWRGK